MLKEIDLFVNVSVDVSVTTVLSKAIVSVSPEILVSIPEPPAIFSVSPKLIVVVDDVSSANVKLEFVKDVLAIVPVIEPVTIKFPSTVNPSLILIVEESEDDKVVPTI